ncbi:hypothetical protein PCANB_000489 [Pneumocystis canis]|nr:hypothetical protein PCANB_000489 [Pneumocystis canis]
MCEKRLMLFFLWFWIIQIKFQWKVNSIPILGFPVNSQVPPVARVFSPFSFRFAQNTFYNIQGDVRYSVMDLPLWLNFDESTRMFYGTPSKNDLGVFRLNLVATDETGSAVNPITFIVVDRPSPSLRIPLKHQLGLYGTINVDGAFTILPNQQFSFYLSKNTFNAHFGTGLTYYCVSENNTPLPSWIKFDPTTLHIWGVSPTLQSTQVSPLYFLFKVIASDVPGFSGTAESFSLMIGMGHLQLRKSYYSVTATVGHPFVFNIPIHTLTRNGVVIPLSEVSRLRFSATSSHWLTLDTAKYILSGTPSSDNTPENVIITIMDMYSYGITLYVRINLVAKDISPSESVSHTELCFPFDTAVIYKRSFLPNITATVGKEFSCRIGDPSLLTIFDHMSVQCLPKNASTWLRFNRRTMLLTGTPPVEGITKIRIYLEDHASNRNYERFFSINAVKVSTPVKKIAFFSPVVILAITSPIFLIIFFLILYCCIRTKIDKRSRFLPTGHRYISRPIPPDARHGQWPTMDERTWDEPQRLSAFDIFKTTSANGLSGFVAEVKETSINVNPNATSSKKYEKTSFVPPCSIRVLPIKEDSCKNAPPYTSRENLHSLSNYSDVSSKTSLGPPGYGMPHRSWRRTTMSSSFWPGNNDYHELRKSAGVRNASINEPFTVKLVSSSTSQSDTYSGIISNPASSNTPSYGSSKELSGKSSDSKITIGSYSGDSIGSKGNINDFGDNGAHSEKRGLYFSKARPWSAQTDDMDSMDSASLVSSEHSRNEFLYDENDDPRMSSVNEVPAYSRNSLRVSDSNHAQYHNIGIKGSTPLHNCVQSISKTDILPTTLHRKGSSITIKSTILDRSKMFDYPYSQKNIQQPYSSHSQESSETAFI